MIEQFDSKNTGIPKQADSNHALQPSDFASALRHDRQVREENDRKNEPDPEALLTAFQQESFPPGYEASRLPPSSLLAINAGGLVVVRIPNGTDMQGLRKLLDSLGMQQVPGTQNFGPDGNLIACGLTRDLSEADRVQLCSSRFIGGISRYPGSSIHRIVAPDSPAPTLAGVNAAGHLVILIPTEHENLTRHHLQFMRGGIERFLAARGFEVETESSPLVKREIERVTKAIQGRQQQEAPSAPQYVLRFRRTRAITAEEHRMIERRRHIIGEVIPDTGR